MEKLIGHCDCGKLSYECTEEPINSVFCYCTCCQQRTNSDKWFGIWVKENGFSITKGESSTFIRQGSSGKDMVHHFCSECGNTVAVYVEAGRFYTVSVATLENSSDFSPNMAIYTASAAPWATFPEGVPKYDTLPPSMGG